MTIVEAAANPVPASVLRTREIRKARVASERADATLALAASEAQQARTRLAQLEAQVAA